MAKTKKYSGQEVLDMVSHYMTESDALKVKAAYEWAADLHKAQLRKSGEPYIIHPIQVAGILAELRMDTATVISGYLHDVVEDTTATLADVEDKFGTTIAQIIDGVTKISKIQYQNSQEQLAENHRKLLLAMSKDIRVIIVKLADRLHNMRTLGALREEKRRRIASETLDIYAPLADRLGISTIKWELEDLSLSYLDPDKYHSIASQMNMKRDERIRYVEEAVREINDAIKDLELDNVSVYGRPKHIYSIYRKMTDKHKAFEEIYDLSAVRVLTDTIPDTYAVLGAIHSQWMPLPGRFKDYIALPKANGYQSLHTTVIGPGGRPLEVQIRTHHMHEVAEYGVAAHWAYKKNKGSNKEVKVVDKNEQTLNVIQGILELQEDAKNAEDFMDGVQGDLFSDRVYAFTPKGDVFELPKGAGPLDMAYSIHTEIGNHTTGAKVNGKIVPLDYQVKNGDIVDILTSQNSAGPSRDWLDLVHTNKARNKVKRFFKQQDRIQNIDRGKDILEEALIEEGYNVHDVLNAKNIERVLAKRHISTSDDMYAALGFGELQPAGIINILTQDIREQKELQRKKQQEKDLLEDHKGIKNNNANSKNKHDESVLIEGIDNLLVRLSHCCNPIPGDEIVGYITKGRGVSVHRTDCPNVKNAEQSGTRLIDVSWNVVSDDRTHYNTDLEIQGYNRSGLLNDVLQAINNTTKQLNSINGRIDHNKMATIDVTVGIRDKVHLQRVIDNIKRVPDVYVVKRTIH